MVKVRRGKRKRESGAGWSVGARVVVSVFLCVHLAAVFGPPFAFETSPVRGLGSPLAESLVNFLRPYIDAAYLNHGYAFFAPDPGPSHLLRARLEFDDGRVPQEITLPDLGRHWPRLLYHRHFMLSEHLHASFVPSEAPPEVMADPARAEAWRRALQMYNARKDAIQEHLKAKHGAARVALTRVEHSLLAPFEVQSLGKHVNDEDTYYELSETLHPGAMP